MPGLIVLSLALLSSCLCEREVETVFGKMARTFLRGMRVASWEELRERILKGIAEINVAPVVSGS